MSLMLKTDEIDDEGANRSLTTPLHRLQPSIPQQKPQRPFRIPVACARMARARLGRFGEMGR